ncbi:MAG: phosphate acyltransferase PlsX [Bacillota bacterium]
MKFAVDAFGGDNAPGAIVEGCVNALKLADDFSLVLTGAKDRIEQELSKYSFDAKRIRIVDAPEIITCEEQPTVAIKQKKNSSLVRALEIVAAKEADCFISAGSTGALLTGATFIVRRLPGVKRPALAPILPTRDGCVLLIDCGANVDCKPHYLQQFAIMGAAYMSGVMGVENPRVGLINNGAEREKGNELTRATYPLLEQAPINFVGNCEARDLVSGEYDVIVCDGFAGNIVLKFMEGLAGTLMGMLKDELMGDFRSKLGAAVAKPAFKRFKKKMDYTEYGGAPLLGIDGGIIKAHGSSNAKAISSALMQARAMVTGNVVGAIRVGIGSLEQAED